MTAAAAAAAPRSEKAKGTTTSPLKQGIKGAAPSSESNDSFDKCLRLIARETGLDVEAFSDNATFVELGVDSLMALVLSEKFRNELGLEIKSSLFLECVTVGDMKAWLEQNC